MKYEYDILIFYPPYNQLTLQNSLNNMGKEGWDLVCVLDEPIDLSLKTEYKQHHTHRYIFKRNKQD
jgi:hypothetical protein